ncbi:MAG: ubiquinone/menaquinone biosynthesis methyltransferase, partial [Flavobacterium sp.]
IIGLDISQGMLEVGKKKILDKKLESKIQMVLGDGEQIPYADNYFDVITIAYGVRNFENLDKGLSEVLRVLKPNGLLLILETSVPTKFPVKQGYYVYTNFIMPAIGKLFSKDKKAYAYLSNSAQNFPFGEALNNILRKIGFIDVKHLPQTLGVATIYKASKK